jgi:hypothetical protein
MRLWRCWRCVAAALVLTFWVCSSARLVIHQETATVSLSSERGIVVTS